MQRAVVWTLYSELRHMQRKHNFVCFDVMKKHNRSLLDVVNGPVIK